MPKKLCHSLKEDLTSENDQKTTTDKSIQVEHKLGAHNSEFKPPVKEKRLIVVGSGVEEDKVAIACRNEVGIQMDLCKENMGISTIKEEISGSKGNLSKYYNRIKKH